MIDPEPYEQGDPVLETIYKGKFVIHRAFPGEHETANDTCWCRPLVVDGDDYREARELIRETEKLDG